MTAPESAAVVDAFLKLATFRTSTTDHVSIVKSIERNWSLEPITHRSRDNFPNPRTNTSDPYVPTNSPALGGFFDFSAFQNRNSRRVRAAEGSSPRDGGSRRKAVLRKQVPPNQ